MCSFKGAASGSKGVAATARGMIDDIPPLSQISGMAISMSSPIHFAFDSWKDRVPANYKMVMPLDDLPLMV